MCEREGLHFPDHFFFKLSAKTHQWHIGGGGGDGVNYRTMLGCQVCAATHRSIHHQKSSSDSPLQANTAVPEGQSRWSLKEKLSGKQMSRAAQTVTPRSASAAATAFWVEKMLQAAQRHWAPNTDRVSISTCRSGKYVNRQGFLNFTCIVSAANRWW